MRQALEELILRTFKSETSETDADYLTVNGVLHFVDENYQTWKEGLYRRIEGMRSPNLMRVLSTTIIQDTPKRENQTFREILMEIGDGEFNRAILKDYSAMLMTSKRPELNKARLMTRMIMEGFMLAYIHYAKEIMTYREPGKT